MKRRVRVVLLVVAVTLVLVATAAVVTVEMGWTRTYASPYPPIAASTAPDVVERGRFLVYGPAACAYCHVVRERWPTLDRGEMLPLTGAHLFPLPFGRIYSANITPDPETGIGQRTDGELARILRHGVRADGHAAVPLMEYQGMSDDDLVAVVSFLRSRPAVRSVVPSHELTLLGRLLMAFAIGPASPASAPPQASPEGPSVARGAYLATKVSACVSCHTDRDGRGELVGPPFGGGQRMDVAADSTKVYVTPNLTPDPATSAIGTWTEDVFLRRFRQGEQVGGSPMPWGAYGRMTDHDLRSVYRYLRSLPPVVHDTGPTVQRKG
jgi:mono/diheme cytochrome c family protein